MKKGLISDPVNKAKSVVLTGDGLQASERLFKQFFSKKQLLVNSFFFEHSLVEGEPLFTVQGKLANEGKVDWASVGIVARVYAGDALMTHCNESIRHVKRQSTRNFRLTCTDTAGSKLPDNISYTLEVISGTEET